MKPGVGQALTALDRAKQLSPPQPGKVVSVPLDLWLEYLGLYGIEVIGARNDVLVCRRLHPENQKQTTGGMR